MIRVERRRDCAPTITFAEAVHAHAGSPRPLKWGLTLRVLPRYMLNPTPDNADLPKATGLAWYDVVWSIKAVHDPTDPGSQPLEPMGGFFDPLEVVEEDAVLSLAWIDVADVGTLPPPPLIPPEQRMGEVNEDGVLTLVQAQVDAMTPGELQFLSGPERAIERLTLMQATAVHSDRSAAAYDWTAAAGQLVELYQILRPPKLTPDQRIRAGGARLVQARRELEDAERSQRALVRNAFNAADGNPPVGAKSKWVRWSATTRPTFKTWLADDKDDSDA